MRIDKKTIADHNDSLLTKHQQRLAFLENETGNTEAVLRKLIDFQVAIPSWALGTGGTRFGRFSGTGEPRSLEEKMEDV